MDKTGTRVSYTPTNVEMSEEAEQNLNQTILHFMTTHGCGTRQAIVQSVLTHSLDQLHGLYELLSDKLARNPHEEMLAQSTPLRTTSSLNSFNQPRRGSITTGSSE